MIYADHAATTQLDQDALQAMLPWLQGEYGNASQTYSFARKPKKALAEAKSIIATCIGAEKSLLPPVERRAITGQSKGLYNMGTIVPPLPARLNTMQFCTPAELWKDLVSLWLICR